jgi:hypothetical protein
VDRPGHDVRAVETRVAGEITRREHHGVVEHVRPVDPVRAEEGGRVAALVLQHALVADRVDRHLGAGIDGEHTDIARAGQPTPEHGLGRRGQILRRADGAGAGLQNVAE